MAGPTVGFDEIIADFGPKIGLRIMKKYAGRMICSPHVRLRALRDLNLYNDYKHGMPDYELAAKYNVKKSIVRQIIRRIRRRFGTPVSVSA